MGGTGLGEGGRSVLISILESCGGGSREDLQRVKPKSYRPTSTCIGCLLTLIDCHLAMALQTAPRRQLSRSGWLANLTNSWVMRRSWWRRVLEERKWRPSEAAVSVWDREKEQWAGKMSVGWSVTSPAPRMSVKPSGQVDEPQEPRSLFSFGSARMPDGQEMWCVEVFFVVADLSMALKSTGSSSTCARTEEFQGSKSTMGRLEGEGRPCTCYECRRG